MKNTSEYFFGDWTIDSFIGKGGFGEVYSISRGNETCAMKVVHINFPGSINSTEQDVKEYLQQGVEEIYNAVSFAKSLESPYILTYHDIETTIDERTAEVLIRMEKLESLDNIIKERYLTEADVVKIGIDICSAMKAIHEKGYIHRDIKISNILFDGTNYKLGDFDFATRVDTKDVVGSFPTAAPEVVQGSKSSNRSDIYSLGMTLKLLLSNLRFRRIRMNGSKELKEIVKKACAKDPSFRFRNANEMLKALMTLKPENVVVLEKQKTKWNEYGYFRHVYRYYAPDWKFGPSYNTKQKVEVTVKSEGPRKQRKPEKQRVVHKNFFNWFFFTIVVSLVPAMLYFMCVMFIENAHTGITVYIHEVIFFSIVLLTSEMKTFFFGNIKNRYRRYVISIGSISALALIASFGLFALVVMSETVETVVLKDNTIVVAIIIGVYSFLVGTITEYVEDYACLPQ